ncbi:lysine 6-monooxygenase, partial [Streptomyces solincola]
AGEGLAACRFGRRVERVSWDAGRGAFAVDFSGTRTGGGRMYARSLALGVGTAPHVPEPLRAPAGDPGVPVLHSADYLEHRERLLAARHVTVVGSGQSGAEVLLDLLRARPAGAEGLAWVARTEAFAPMEYSKIGLEQFTPDYTAYFRALPEGERDALLPAQWQLYKGVSGETLGEIHDELYRRTLGGGWPDVVLTPGVAVEGARRRDGRLELALHHRRQGTRAALATDAVVLATGYRERPLETLLGPLEKYLGRDGAGRALVDGEQRLVLDPAVGGSVFVQNAERHSHGVGTPDLGLAAWRSAVIVNAVARERTGHDAYDLPSRTAFTTFGLPGPRPERGSGPGQGGGGSGGSR